MTRRPGPRTRSLSLLLDNKTHWPGDEGATKRPRRSSLSMVNEEPSDVRLNDSGGEECGRGKVLMRDWLLLQANENRIPGLRWMQVDGERYLKIPWQHGSKASWTIEDCRVFESWAKYTGKYWSSPRNPKKWKANFRCAINSLPDVEEMKSMGCKSGIEAFKVYKFLPEQPRKHRVAAELKRRTIIPSTHSLDSPSSSHVSCSSNSLEFSTEIKIEDSLQDDGRSPSSIEDVSSGLCSSSSLRLQRRPTPVGVSSTVPPTISPSSSSSSSKTDPKDVLCPQETLPSLSRRPGLLPLYVAQMSVDDDDDDDDDDDIDDDIDEQSKYLPCIEENEADNNSEDDDNDNDGDDDDDDDKDNLKTFLESCDRHGKHLQLNGFSHVNSKSVSESWFPNSNQCRPAISAAPNCASSFGLTSHEIETNVIEATYIPTSSVSSASMGSQSDNSSSLPLPSAALGSGIDSLEMHEFSDFDSPDFADMLDDWLPLIQYSS